MSLSIASINSGSNGNCYYFGNHKDAILIDAGLSCKEIEKRLARLNLSLESVKAIFISHEHSDHIFGVAGIYKKYKIPFYMTTDTWNSGHLKIPYESIRSSESIEIGSLKVLPFPTSHDAANPHMFTVTSGSITAGVFTDLGYACNHVKEHFSRCHAAFLESNYDDTMLAEGHYPEFLKNRIRSDKGHLSNLQALEIFRNHKSPYLSHLFLSHLSKENNSSERVIEMFGAESAHTSIFVADRTRNSDLIHLDMQTTPAQNPEGTQLKLF
jgi:phosphoribosyl 1,2-cyclic phosphodiesterase